MVNPQTDKLVRRTTMVATVTASYFLLTADYGSEPNALDPFLFYEDANQWKDLHLERKPGNWQNVENALQSFILADKKWYSAGKKIILNLTRIISIMAKSYSYYDKDWYSSGVCDDTNLQWQIKKAIVSAENTVKEFIFGTKKDIKGHAQCKLSLLWGSTGSVDIANNK
ncbi:hypothetical protein CFP56_022831 [Quercus suber]|uniref:Uncharacterized protein n=1 Tax=Quercus suber TaxID=58331 RepID=A0AAW0IN38_QUESU